MHVKKNEQTNEFEKGEFKNGDRINKQTNNRDKINHIPKLNFEEGKYKI